MKTKYPTNAYLTIQKDRDQEAIDRLVATAMSDTLRRRAECRRSLEERRDTIAANSEVWH